MDPLRHLPEHLKDRRTADAVTAPSAIVAAGGGAAVAILVGAPLLGVGLLGALAYGVAVAIRLPRAKRSPAIDPRTLREPWASLLADALDARRRFSATLLNVADGPVRDRLSEIGTRVEAAVQECARVARRGDALERGVSSLELSDVRARLARMRESEPSSPSGPESRERTIEALEAQIASGERLDRVAADARDRLGLLDARLDEAVARSVELSLQAEDASVLSGLGADVDALVGDLEALRQGLEEISATR